MIDPSWSTPRPLVLNQRERCRSLANLRGNTTDYLGISPDLPEWRPRRSSYEDRRGAVGVTPSEVNTLVPYIPPIDTSLPPPSREWLDAMAKQFLADAHADFEDPHRHATLNVTDPRSSLTEDDNAFFDYDTDSTLDGAVSVPRVPVSQPAQQASQAESESNTDTDTDTDTDSDSDMDSDDGYNWSTTRISDSTSCAPADPSPWIIPRKRPSVVIIDKRDVMRNGSSSSSDDEHAGKRRRGGKSAPYRPFAKTHKRYANDTPARHGGKRIGIPTTESDPDSYSERSSVRTSSLGEGTTATLPPSVSSVAAAAAQMNHVRIASPRIATPPILPLPNTPTMPPKTPKLFPCLLDGCSQVCASAGDLQRHQQSLRHRAPSHGCLACGKSYTRSDALKRHLNSKAACKKEHAVKVTNNADVEEAGAEANTEAV